MGQIIEWRCHRHELNLLNDGLAAPGVNLSAHKGWEGEDLLLGLLGETEGGGARILDAFDVSLEQAQKCSGADCSGSLI